MPDVNARLTTVTFSQFKAFANYTLSLDRINLLVGPNNSGKSTILGAFRTLAAGLRVARSKSAQRVRISEEEILYGYVIRNELLPISLENVHTDYSNTDTFISFNLNNGSRLRLVFPLTGGCYLIPKSKDGSLITSPTSFRKHFPLDITAVPVLGPVEHREIRREKDTVVAGLNTHRASRHFRSYWNHLPEGFSEYANLVAATWPGMEIQPPELADPINGELAMFCLENRITRELYWAGFGFQVWCQLLTHVSRSKRNSLLIVDEPEVYLHPDVQRQLLGLLREAGPDILLATHSTEIMAEADPTEILLIDKKKQRAERLRDVTGVQRALATVGSIQNITLTTLARNRKILFVEGDSDFRLLRRIAKKIGFVELSSGLGITALESGGFGSWQKVTTLAEGIEDALGTKLYIGAIYDRDFHCDEEIEHIGSSLKRNLEVAHIHERKEIENYLLIPSVLDRAVKRAVAERAARANEELQSVPDVQDLLSDITDSRKTHVIAQLLKERENYFRSNKKDSSTIYQETLEKVDVQWGNLDTRMELVSGKEVLAELRTKYQEFGISLTDAKIIDAMYRNEVPQDLLKLLSELEAFRTKQV